MVWVNIVIGLMLVQIVYVFIGERRDPAKTNAWLLVLFIFPVIGFIFYLLIGAEYGKRRRVRRRTAWKAGNVLRFCLRTEPAGAFQDASIEIKRTYPRLFEFLEHMPEAPITLNNKVEVLTNAERAYPAMLEAIEQARHHIHFEFYTIRHDDISTKFQKLLIQKAKQGVRVRCIFDGIGSYRLDHRFVCELREAGAEVYFFLPVMLSLLKKRVNYRNHRKIVVVDGEVGFLGGINIGNEYLGGNRRLGFWRDTHLALRGDVVYSLQHTFLTDWCFVSGQSIVENRELFPAHSCKDRCLVQVMTSGPDAHWDAILEMYFSAINGAKRKVYITSPYFIPDPSLLMALKCAALSGVDVRVIIPSVPDSKLVQLASLTYVEELLQAGVRFFAYQRGFIHSKVLIIDDILCSVGTANMDMRSFFSNFEMNAVLFDQDTVYRLMDDFMQDLQASKEIKRSFFEGRSRWERAKGALARILSPLL